MPTRVERLAFVLTANEAKLVRGLRKAADEMGRLERESGRATTKMETAFARLDTRVNAVSNRVARGLFSMRTALTALATGAGAAAPIKFASDFEKALANVDTLLQDATVSVERYEEQLLSLAQASSKELLDLTQGLYQTISAGIPAVEGAGGAFEVLTQAQRAAVAGLATTEEAVDAFTTILNAYSESGITAAEVSDKLFTTVRVGKTTFPELAGSIGRVATVSAQFSISVEEMLAALASLTKVGLSTDEAATALRATILGLSNPTDRARKLFQELGVEIGEEAFKEGGLQTVLAAISEATGDSADAIVEMIPNVRALVGAMALGSDGAKNLERDLASLRNSTGATDVAYEKIARTFSETAAIFKSQVNAVLIAAGDRVLPRVQEVIKNLGDAVVANQDRIGEAFEQFIDTLLAIADFLDQHGKRLLAFFAAFFATQKIAAATIALQKFFTVLAAGIAASGGASAGGAFLTGFQKAARSLPALLSGLLRSPTAIGLFITAGLFIGQLIGDQITAETERALADAEKQLEASTRELNKRLQGLGFSSVDEQRALTGEVNRGERVVFGATGQTASLAGAGKADLLTPKEALDRLVAEGADLEDATARVEALALAASRRSEERAVRLAAQAGTVASQQRAILAAYGQIEDKDSARARELDARFRALGETLAGLRGQEREAQEAAGRIRDLSASAAEDRQFAEAEAEIEERSADAASRRARAAAERLRSDEDAEKAAERALRLREAVLERAIEAEGALAQASIAAGTAAFETRRAQVEAIASLQQQALEDQQREELDALRARGAEEEELESARLRHLDERARLEVATGEARLGLLADQEEQEAEAASARIAALEREADIAIEAAERQGRETAAAFQRGSEKRIEVEQATVRRVAALRERLAFESAVVEEEAAQAVAEIQLDAAREQASIVAAERDQDERAAERALTAAEGTFAGFVASVAVDLDRALARGARVIGDALVSAASRAADVFVDRVVDPVADALSAPLDTLLSGLQGAVGSLLNLDIFDPEAIRNAEQSVQAAVDDALRLADRIVAALPALIETALQAFARNIGPLAQRIAEAFGASLQAVAENLGDVLSATIDALVDALPTIVDALVRSTPLIFEALLEGVRQLLQALPQIIATAVAGVTDLIGGLLDVLSRQLGPLVVDVINGALGAVVTVLRNLGALVDQVVSGLLNVVSGLLESLPDILSAIIEQVPQILLGLVEAVGEVVTGLINGVLRALPRLLNAIPKAVEGILSDSLPALISGLVEAVGSLFEGLVANLGETLLDLVPALLSGLAGLIPGLVVAVVKGIGGLFEKLLDGIKDFFSGEFFEDLGALIFEAIKAIGEAVAGAAGFGEGGFFDALTGGKAEGIGGAFGEEVGQFTGLSGLGKIVRGDFGDLDLEDIPVVGKVASFFAGLFHSGGKVAARHRHPLTAAAFHLAGAPAFAAGGAVRPVLDRRIARALGARMSDDVPAILQVGEQVLSKVGVAAAGGDQAVAALNQGRSQPGVQVLQPVIEADNAGLEALLQMVIGRWRVEATTPGSGVQAALDSGNPFVGLRMVRGRT